jgi:UDP-N-acetyl-D-mannosaminuronic acid dehydrogenase
MPFREEGADVLLGQLVRSGLLKATSDCSAIKETEAVVVTIGTPVGEYLDPSIGSFDRALREISQQLAPGQLLILRSTVFPGVTDRLARQLREAGKKDVLLAYCPERIVQGKALMELEQLPQIIAGTTLEASNRAAAIFSIISKKVLFLTPIDAELAKLFCNAYRYINFAISNQFYMMAKNFDANFEAIYEAVRDNYPRMQSLSKPGFAAGPCLVKDTMQLGAFNHAGFPLGQAAMLVNEGLPGFVVRDLKRKYPLAEMTVGLLGMAFKPNNDDPRDSLSYKLRKTLQMECRRVLCTDPFVNDPTLVPLTEVVESSDLIVVGTPHDCYHSLSFRQPVIDIGCVLKRGGPTTAVEA